MPPILTRRSVLRVGASTFVASLAGCVGSGDDTPSETVGEGAEVALSTSDRAEPRTPSGSESDRRSELSADGQPNVPTPTAHTPTTSISDEMTTDGILLPSINVAGSPGGLVSIHPPGKVVLMDFFATWCPPCEPEMANLREARAKFDSDEVFIVSITPERDRNAIATFWENNGGTWPVVMDPDLWATVKYGVTTTPTALAFTTDGVEVFRHTGLAGSTRIIEAIETGLSAGTA